MAKVTQIHLVIPDQHAHPDFNNDRAHWIGKLIHDIRPDVVVNLGDGADLHSLATYDKGTKSAIGRNYRRDIDAHLDFQERMWYEVRKHKKRLPQSYYLIGNHEHRIERAINIQPELEGAISMDDLKLKEFYDEVVPYAGNTPGSVEIDGITYAHFHVTGVMGRATGGEHPAYSLITKKLTSCTQGHTHVLDYSIRTTASGRRVHGLVAGVYQDFDSPWAGEVNKIWWRGVVVKRNVHDGDYDPEFISIGQLRQMYA